MREGVAGWMTCVKVSTVAPHPNRRMGLHEALSLTSRPPRGPARLDLLPQTPQAPHLDREATTNHETEQAPRTSHLAALTQSSPSSRQGRHTGEVGSAHLAAYPPCASDWSGAAFVRLGQVRSRRRHVEEYEHSTLYAGGQSQRRMMRVGDRLRDGQSQPMPVVARR